MTVYTATYFSGINSFYLILKERHQLNFINKFRLILHTSNQRNYTLLKLIVNFDRN